MPSTAYPNHNKIIRLDFLESYTYESTWKEMSSKGTITIPKNLYYKDEGNALNPLNGSKVNIGGFNSEPLIMRGDKITLTAGYRYQKPSLTWGWVDETSQILDGYITRVHAKIPITFDVEDNMWLLKQTALKNKTYKATDTIETILKDIVSQVADKHPTADAIVVNQESSTTVGAIIVENETGAQFLERLHKLFGLTTYMRGNELRCGVMEYNTEEAQEQIFIMNGQQGNVPADGQELEFQRKEDVVVSTRAYNTIEKDNGSNKDGSKKLKKERIEVLVTLKNGEITTTSIKSGEHTPDNTEGERTTFFDPSAKTEADLIAGATKQLELMRYDGLTGSFQAFGIPFVRYGDNVRIKNPKQPEQDGLYKVKGVTYSGGTSGLRQTIKLHYKIG